MNWLLNNWTRDDSEDIMDNLFESLWHMQIITLEVFDDLVDATAGYDVAGRAIKKLNKRLENDKV